MTEETLEGLYIKLEDVYKRYDYLIKRPDSRWDKIYRKLEKVYYDYEQLITGDDSFEDLEIIEKRLWEKLEKMREKYDEDIDDELSKSRKLNLYEEIEFDERKIREKIDELFN